MTAYNLLFLVFKKERSNMRNAKGQFIKGTGIKDLTGNRYGRLIAIKLDHIKNRKSYWLCQCDCGNQKIIRSDCLGTTLSCGCLKKEQDVVNLNITNNHNLTNHPASRIWYAMMNRCNSENNEHYNDYGGRGIKVCEEWHDIRNFCRWMDEHNYKKGLSIERIDVNGNYEPSNCCLIPRSEQAYNKRNTVKIIHNGKEISLAKEARRLGLSPKAVILLYYKGIRDYEKLFAKEVFNG